MLVTEALVTGLWVYSIVYYALLVTGFFGGRSRLIYPEMYCFLFVEERICVYHN
jgi:hypothetical protein